MTSPITNRWGETWTPPGRLAGPLPGKVSPAVVTGEGIRQVADQFVARLDMTRVK